MTRLIVYLVIAIIISLIFLTFLAVMIRRFYMNRRYRLLDAELVRYSPLIHSLASGAGVIDMDLLKKKPGSIAWIAIEDLLFKALENPSYGKGAIIAYFDEFGYVDHYIESLHTGSKWERALAVDKLGRVKSKRALPHLVSSLEAKYRDQRNMAVHSLGVMRETDTASYLVELLKYSIQNQEEVSLRIVKSSLISFGEEAVEKLLPELKNPSWRIRAAAVDILGEIGSPEAVQPLIDILKDPERDVRAKAAKGLEKIKDHASVPVLPLLVRLEDPFWIVRLHAARALGFIGDPVAIEYLNKRMRDRNWQVRKTAAEALGRIGGAAYAALLEVFLTSGDRYAREQALDQMERAGVIKKLMAFLLDKGDKGRKTDARAGMENMPLEIEGGESSMTTAVFLRLSRVLNTLGHDRLREALTALAGKDFSAEDIEEAISQIGKLMGLRVVGGRDFKNRQIN